MKEQYQLLLEKVIAHSEGKHNSLYDDAFICNIIQSMGSPTLLSDFRSRKPSETQYVEFYNHRLYNKSYDVENAWWDCIDFTAESNEQRILFLKKIVSEL